MVEGLGQLETELLGIAHDKSQGGRRTLVTRIADLFSDDARRYSSQERALMADILTKLIAELELAIRSELAERLAQVPACPHELILLLANDEIEVARPILLASSVLTDPDLIEIIEHRTMEHRLAIAMRSGVSEHVADALVEYGNEDVIEALLCNPDAALSQRAREYLVYA